MEIEIKKKKSSFFSSFSFLSCSILRSLLKIIISLSKTSKTKNPHIIKKKAVKSSNNGEIFSTRGSIFNSSKSRR